MAKPTKTSKIGTAHSSITSNLILWEGADIPCIDLCKGDMVSDVIYKIAIKICDLVEDYDELKTLELDCVIDKLNVVRPDDDNFTFKVLFQILLDNDCKLKDLIDSITNQSTGQVLDFSTLDLKCLEEEFIDCEECDEENLVSILQKIVDKICEHVQTIIDINNEIVIINDKIQTLEDRTNTSNPIVEAEINTCLNPSPATPLPISDHIVTITDPEVCDIRTILGSDTNLLSAFTRGCPSDYSGLTGFYDAPTTIAQSISSLYVMSCTDHNAILDCCKPSCAKVKLGFGTTFNSSTSDLTVVFTPSYGMSIPNGLTDCGSIVTVTDINNNIATAPIILSNNASVTIDVSGLDTTNYFTVSLKSCVSSDDIKCEDCIDKVVGPFELIESCDLCRFCVQGPDGSYIILDYTVNGIQKTVELNPDTCITFKIPDEVVIFNSVVAIGGAVLAKDAQYFCDSITIPTSVAETCWFFELPRETQGIGSSAIDTDYYYTGVESSYGNFTLGGVTIVDGTFTVVAPNGLPSGITVESLCQIDTDISDEIGIILRIVGQNIFNPPLLVINQRHRAVSGGNYRDVEILVRGQLRESCACE